MTSDLCSYLKSIIQPLTGKRVSHVSNHKDFCSALKPLTIAQNHVMVSYDVKDLFTSIPMAHTLSTLQRLLDSDSTLHQRTSLNPFHIVKLVSFCMNEGNYFRFLDMFYAKTNGAPMGSSLSPVLAEVFMEEFEEMAFNNDCCPVTTILFKRYVDDCFAILEEGDEITLLQHLNSIFPGKIMLTMEKEENNGLPFLDVMVRREESKLTTMVYRKPTHSDRYLHFTSHHPLSVKRGIAIGMIDRALAICDPKHLGSELNHIAKALKLNGYPISLVKSITQQRLQKTRTERIAPHTECPVVTLPYFRGIGERIKRLGLLHDFRVFFKSSPNLRALTRTDKIKGPPEETPEIS
uniref:Reverse transcriptase domain-containing protein n=1 Tax=Trichuris muris TaxID=70415 RepID=A0A5S6Q0J6_TRIMR